MATTLASEAAAKAAEAAARATQRTSDLAALDAALADWGAATAGQKDAAMEAACRLVRGLV